MDSDVTVSDTTEITQDDRSEKESQLPPSSHFSILNTLSKATRPQKITFVVLCLFLVIRITAPYWSFLQDGIGFWLFVNIQFPSFAYVIWLNRDNLSTLNINKSFFIIFLVSGLLIGMYDWKSLGIFIIGTSIFLFINDRKGWFNFTKAKIDNRNLFKPFELILFGLYLLLSLISIITGYYEKTWQGNISWIVSYRLWGVVYEEMLFRGMLWMFLAILGLQDKKIVIIQAFIFWIAHSNSISSPSFWLSLPLLSFWYGALVKRSKSLVPSTIVHSVINILLDVSSSFV